MNTQTIEVDAETAAVLKARAVEHGLTVAELVAQMIVLQDAEVAISRGDIAALDRQWAAIKAGEPTVPHEEVGRWLRTWGTPEFKSRHER